MCLSRMCFWKRDVTTFVREHRLFFLAWEVSESEPDHIFCRQNNSDEEAKCSFYVAVTGSLHGLKMFCCLPCRWSAFVSVIINCLYLIPWNHTMHFLVMSCVSRCIYTLFSASRLPLQLLLTWCHKGFSTVIEMMGWWILNNGMCSEMPDISITLPVYLNWSQRQRQILLFLPHFMGVCKVWPQNKN